ncbi:MAG: hypothetical protein BMS9Abin37_3317 [Acidobacteriota bacterium]|nr:MAG: hypothetical protein BMS9Abin37_3317 [Acidobacteriota bacterium]
MKRRIGQAAVFMLLLSAPQANAQLVGRAVYELGVATTDVGDDEGAGQAMYGFGLSLAYTFVPGGGGLGFVFGADLLVRGFGIDVPGRFEGSAGVFDQSDLLVDEFVGLQIRDVIAGLYFEQRRINRGTLLGKIGFPASGIGVLVRLAFEPARSYLQITYAGFSSGELQLQGADMRPEVDSGRSIRISGQYAVRSHWAIRGEYADTRMGFAPNFPLFDFYDHRQRTVSAGVSVEF